MPPVDTTTLRGALLTLAQDDAAWLDAVDQLLGRVLTGTSIRTSIHGLYGWIDGGEAPKLVRDQLAHVIEQLRARGRYKRLERVFAVHTVLVATAFFETVREVLTHELQLGKSDWQQEDHSFVSYLYSDEMPTPSATRGFAANVDKVGRWAADRSERVHRTLHRTSPGSGSEVLLDPAFVRRMTSRYETDFRTCAGDIPEFAIWATEKGSWQTLASATKILPLPGDLRTTLHSANRAVLAEPAFDVYLTPNYRLTTAGPSAKPADDSWWSSEVAVQHDLDALLSSHVTTPDAFRQPLLIVGGPGSGKSMLAVALAARLPPSDYTVVRVPLQTANPDIRVLDQIDEALRRQTDDRVDWSSLVRQSEQQTSVVVLDGLDEMPLSIDWARNYLDSVIRFQQTEFAVGHPVAVLITSRTSFLDQLLIPDGTPVVQLAEFDHAQIGQWIEAWNRRHTGGPPLTLDAALQHPELARNPLLLSMLAHQLTDPAVVLPSGSFRVGDLFQRAIEGLVPQSPDFRVPGIAALGMLNRGWRPISETELRADLVALGYLGERPVEPVLRDLEQRPATFAEYRIAVLVLDLLGERNDELLFTLLSHVPLSLRPDILEFITQLAGEMPAPQRRELAETLDDLLLRYHSRNGTGLHPAYRPRPPSGIRSLAAYSANLVLLRLFVIPAEVGATIPRDALPELADVWKAGLDDHSRRSVSSMLVLEARKTVRRLAHDIAQEAQLDSDAPPVGIEFVHRGLTAGSRAVTQITWSSDGELLTTSYGGNPVVCWRTAENTPPEVVGEFHDLSDVAWHPTRPIAAIVQRGRDTRYVLINRLETGTNRQLCAVPRGTRIAWSPDGESLALFSPGGLWTVDVTTGERRTVATFDHWVGKTPYLLKPRWSNDGGYIWAAGPGAVLGFGVSQGVAQSHMFAGQTHDVLAGGYDGTLIAIVPDGRIDLEIFRHSVGGSHAVLEGHTKRVTCARFSPNGDYLASMCEDNTVRIWRCADWQCVAVLPRKKISGRGGLAFHRTKPLLAIKDGNTVDIVRLDYQVLGSIGAARTARLYSNAKIVLVGDTGVGKSGLGLVMSGQPFAPTDSTHGRNVWTFEKSIETTPSGDVQTRETLLWDLAGQPGYRMVHQLHLNEVAVALVVFDARSETDPFAGVQYWSRALAQARRLDGAAAVRLKAYLVAARTDRGGTAASTARIEQAVEAYGFDGYIETSAKEGWGVDELIRTAREAIDWDAVPVVSSTALFSSIKDFVIEEKRQGRILATVDDLLHSFRRIQQDETPVEELTDKFVACLGRLESVGVIRRMAFGDYVLLRPELLDAYVSSLVQAAKDEPDGLGFVSENDALEGAFRMPESERLTNRQQERVLLITVVEELLRREIALKEVTDKEVDLIFPSQFTRERPDAPQVPGQDVVFTFDGDLQSVYSTLAVRLSHSRLFQRDEMWHNSAVFKADAGGKCGIAIRELQEGRGELVLFYDEQVQPIVRRQFEAYVVEHLSQRANNVVLRRVRRCKPCNYAIDDEVVQRRLGRGHATVICQICDAVISIVDEEQPDVRPVVAEMNSNANAQRDQDVAATTLKGKREAQDYDVFLCHNVKDKPRVREIAKLLEARGILPWLDERAIQPGSRWQQEMEDGIEKCRSAAVLLGPAGPGQWQRAEMDLIRDWSVRGTRKRVIPVVLGDVTGDPELPGFLKVWSAVDMRTTEPDPIEQLVWGITGEQPRWL